MSEHAPDPLPEAYGLADYLVGPFNAGVEQAAGLEPWQEPYYQVALGALRARAGQPRVPEDWYPAPAEGAVLYRELAYERKLHGMVGGLKCFIAEYKAGTSPTILRADQQQVMDSLVDGLVNTGAIRQITAKAPTGSGKTVIMANLIKGLKRGEQPNDPVRVLTLVPSKDILGQTVKSFAEFAPEIQTGVYYSEKKDMQDVTVMTYRSFDMSVRSGKLTRDMVDVIINDEEHEAAGRSTSHSMETFCSDPHTGKRKVTFGLSATPRAVHELAYEKTVLEAIDDGVLSPISVIGRETGATIHETRPRRGTTREDYTPEELQGLIDNDPRNELIIKEVVSGLASGRRVIVRCLPGGKLLHPNLLNERLRKITTTIVDPYTRISHSRPIRPVVIDGDMPMAKRRLLSNAFNNHLVSGDEGLDVLLFVNTLVRGWDSPIAKKVINGSPSLSWTIMEQLLGRMTRPFKRMDGKAVYGQAVDIIDQSKSGQVLFSDVVNRYAPAGMRYIAGRVIGPGLRDPRRADALGEVFEPIPIREDAASEEGTVEELSTQTTDSLTEHVTSGSQTRGIESAQANNPFEKAGILPDNFNSDDYVSLAVAASQLDVGPDEIEDAVFDKKIVLYRTDESVDSNYYISSVSLRRISSWLENH